jgi:hypothetical protein
MAVDPSLVLKDMYPFDVGDHDERVVRDGWTYYVQAVKRPRSLGRPGLGESGGIGEAVVGGLIDLFLEWRARNNPWTVGVVRIGYIGSWNDQTPVVVYREVLAVGEKPAARVAGLVRKVQAGEFAVG